MKGARARDCLQVRRDVALRRHPLFPRGGSHRKGFRPPRLSCRPRRENALRKMKKSLICFFNAMAPARRARRNSSRTCANVMPPSQRSSVLQACSTSSWNKFSGGFGTKACPGRLSRGEYLSGLLLAKLLDWSFLDAAQAVFFGADGRCDLEKNRIGTACGDAAQGAASCCPAFMAQRRTVASVHSRAADQISPAPLQRGRWARRCMKTGRTFPACWRPTRASSRRQGSSRA